MKVVVIKIAAIGDILMATPALRALKQEGQAEVLGLLAGRSMRAVVEANPHLDRIHYIDDRRLFRGSFAARAAEVLKAAWRLRRERYDVGLNFHRDWRYNLILWLGGCRRRIGFARAGARRSRRFLLTDAEPLRGVKHNIFRYCDLVRRLGPFCLDFRMVFPLSPGAAATAAAKFLGPTALDEAVALAPGGAANVKQEMSSRRWSAENFAALAGMLLRAGRPVLLLGGDNDAAIAAVIRAAQPGVVDLSGRTTLAEAAALMGGARLVIANDSGLMHLAAAVKAPLIAIFGPTPPEELKPLTAASATVWKGEGLGCAPCYRDGVFPDCPRRECLERITPREIFDLAQRMMETT